MRGRLPGNALLVLVLATGGAGFAPAARAQSPADSLPAPVAAPIPAPAAPPAAAPESTATQPYTPAFPPPAAPLAPAASAAAPSPRGPAVGRDRDRFEIGAGIVQGYFSTVGSLGYRRFAVERHGWQQWVLGEVTGSRRADLTEGVASAYYLVRPRSSYRESARLRPLLEAGPGLHLAVQASRLRPFNQTPFHARAFLKTHLYGGFEVLLSEGVGFLVRGRISVPNHQPFDYAQAAIFLR
jgi:hypothetical protein